MEEELVYLETWINPQMKEQLNPIHWNFSDARIVNI